jgi:hypothetical protein
MEQPERDRESCKRFHECIRIVRLCNFLFYYWALNLFLLFNFTFKASYFFDDTKIIAANKPNMRQQNQLAVPHSQRC